MGIQLKPGLFKSDFDLDSIHFEDIMEADANTRYRYTIAKLSKSGHGYTLYKNGKLFIYKNSEDNTKSLLLWPDRQAAEFCKMKDDSLIGTEVVQINGGELYHSILSSLRKKKIFVSIYTNLKDTIELPARDFKIDWFEYLLYDMKQDWMFDE